MNRKIKIKRKKKTGKLTCSFYEFFDLDSEISHRKIFFGYNFKTSLIEKDFS